MKVAPKGPSQPQSFAEPSSFLDSSFTHTRSFPFIRFSRISISRISRKKQTSSNDSLSKRIRPIQHFVFALLLVSCEQSEPVKVVKQYREANTWEERLKYVKNPGLVKPLMEDYYTNNATIFPQPFLEIEKPVNTNVPLGDWTLVKVISSRGENTLGMTVSEAAYYDVQHTTEGYKIDWESSIPYNSMTAAEFKSTTPKSPVRFRVVAKLSDAYPYFTNDSSRLKNDSFRLKNWSISLMVIRRANSASADSLGFGFIEKDSTDGKALYELIRSGSERNVTVDISYSRDIPGPVFFQIDKFVCPNWHRPE